MDFALGENVGAAIIAAFKDIVVNKGSIQRIKKPNYLKTYYNSNVGINKNDLIQLFSSEILVGAYKFCDSDATKYFALIKFLNNEHIQYIFDKIFNNLKSNEYQKTIQASLCEYYCKLGFLSSDDMNDFFTDIKNCLQGMVN